MKDIKEFFIDNGITQVTIQPEFYTKSASIENLPLSNCLMQCQGENCKINHCCPTGINSMKDATIVKSTSKEKLPGSLELDLKSIKILENDLTVSTPSLKTHSSESEGNEGSSLEIGDMKQEDDKEANKTDEVSVAECSDASEDGSSADNK